MEVVSFDPVFDRLVLGNASVECLWTGGRWVEGPVYLAEHSLLVWSDIPENRMLWRHDSGAVGPYRLPSHYANGSTRDLKGRLISCEHGGRRVVRAEIDGTLTVLADEFAGKKLNSPNDVVVDSQGGIWFTDPTYGILSDYEGGRRAPEQNHSGVYYVPAPGEPTQLVISDLEQPNGLAFSPDESVFYVADSGLSHNPSGAHQIWAYDFGEGGSLSGKRKFADVSPGIPDGFCIDEFGNVWTSAADGVHCYSPRGFLLGKVLLPEVASNCILGGVNRNRLIVTASTSVYSLYVAVRGATRPAKG